MTLAELRHRRVLAHAEALRTKDPEERWVRAYTANLGTVDVAGRAMVDKHGGEFDLDRTTPYWREATEAPDLPDEEIDAAAVGLVAVAWSWGTVEFAHQDPRPWRKRWVHTPSDNPRAEHEELDGMVVGIDEDFGSWSSPGGDGCQCYVELVPPGD